MDNDYDPEYNPLTAALASATSHGSLSFQSDGTFTYTPDAGSVGTDSFFYTLSNGSDTANATTYIDVYNSPPSAADDEYGVLHDMVLYGASVLTNDYDPDNDAVTAVLVSGPSSGALTFQSDGMFTYTPAALFVGTVSFVYEVTDGLASTQATAYIHVFNSPPVASDSAVSTLHGRPISGAISAYDPDNDPISFSVAGSATAYGSLILRAVKTFDYVPEEGFVGSDLFFFHASDEISVASGMVYIEIDDTAPNAEDDTFDVGLIQMFHGSVAWNDSDPDGDSLTFLLVSGPSSAREFTLRPDGSFDYHPLGGFIGTDQFTYRATNGVTFDQATVTLIVDGDYTITLKLAAFIRQSLGYDLQWDTAAPAGVQDVRWLPEPGGGGPGPHWYFATDDRSAAGEEGTSRIASVAVINTAWLGALDEEYNYFGTYCGPSHHAQRLASLFANMLESATASPTASGDSGNYGTRHSWISVTGSAAYPLIAVAPSID